MRRDIRLGHCPRRFLHLAKSVGSIINGGGGWQEARQERDASQQRLSVLNIRTRNHAWLRMCGTYICGLEEQRGVDVIRH